MPIGEKIRALRKDKQLTQRELARRAGVSPQYLCDVECGRVNPSLSALEKIAAGLGLPTVALLTERDPRDLETVEIPVIGSVPAGGPVVTEEAVLDYLPLPRRLAREGVFALEVSGDSMRDMGIEHGDIVLVRQQPVAEVGQTVIVRVEGEVTCKRYYPRGNKIRLEPANSSFQPLEFNPDKVEIVGVVTHVIKKVR
ncbi:MAG: transcriptional repressor LexA [Bacillota bacterium]